MYNLILVLKQISRTITTEYINRDSLKFKSKNKPHNLTQKPQRRPRLSITNAHSFVVKCLDKACENRGYVKCTNSGMKYF
jgi:hypothetical protein